MQKDDTETSFDFTSVAFYLFLYNETFTYNMIINSYFLQNPTNQDNSH